MYLTMPIRSVNVQPANILDPVPVLHLLAVSVPLAKQLCQPITSNNTKPNPNPQFIKSKPDAMLGLFAMLPENLRTKIYDHLLTSTPTISILSSIEVSMPSFSATSHAFRTELNTYHAMTRNRTLAEVSTFHRLCHSEHNEDFPAIHTIDFQSYAKSAMAVSQDVWMRMVRFERLYDVRLIEKVFLRPVVRKEVKAGVGREWDVLGHGISDGGGEGFLGFLKCLRFLKSVREVEVRAESWDGCGKARRERFLQAKGGKRCPFWDERNCEWPMDVVWACFAVVLRKCVGVKVKVLLDGVQVDLEEVVCEYVENSRAMGVLKKRVMEEGKKMGICRRDLLETCDPL